MTTTINKLSDLLPGYINLFVIPVSNIVATGNEIEVFSLDDVFQIQASVDSIHHEVTHINDENGSYFQHQVTATLQGYSTENASKLERCANTPVILRMQRDDGNFIRLGDKTNALVFTAPFSSTKPGYDLLFTGEFDYEFQPNPSGISQQND